MIVCDFCGLRNFQPVTQTDLKCLYLRLDSGLETCKTLIQECTEQELVENSNCLVTGLKRMQNAIPKLLISVS